MYQYNKTLQKMSNFDNITIEIIKKHNPNWPQVFDHP